MRKMNEKDLSTVAGGLSAQDLFGSPLTLAISIPQTNVNTTTQVAAGNIGGGAVSQAAAAFQANFANVSL